MPDTSDEASIQQIPICLMPMTG